MRTLTPVDNLLIAIEQSLKANSNTLVGTGRPNPAAPTSPDALSSEESRHSAALMRVNHAGEIAAQALYHGQSVFARDALVRERLTHSALEEEDHLIWCEERVHSLRSHTSRLGPFWYWGSFTIGAIAGASGDKWSLGFIKETEDQVIEHLKGHLKQLPPKDTYSRRIIKQMIIDEGEHGDAAVEAGGVPLPTPVKAAMKLTAKIMTSLSYRL
ncbi:MAG: 2-polyprenyl-3-methyl-6-methoxy-1,4-benzoquinone monooxygenase [bacterium]